MEVTYEWNCKTVDVHPTKGSETDVVYNVHWIVTGVSDELDPDGNAYQYSTKRSNNVEQEQNNKKQKLVEEEIDNSKIKKEVSIEEKLISKGFPTFSKTEMLRFTDPDGNIDWDRVTRESKKRWLEANIRLKEKEKRRPITPEELTVLETQIGAEYSSLVEDLTTARS